MANEEKFIEKQLVSLEQIGELHKKIKDIDPSMEKLYPIAVVKNNVYFVFDLDQSGEKYELKMEYPSETELSESEDVLGAYPLGFYNDVMAAVISQTAFATLEGQIAVFHEFVHCFQWDEGERDLKQTLTVAREAWEKRDFMWELNHPFPYESEIFISKTGELDNEYDIGTYHIEMKAALDEQDFEYMMWQEWKEGYARYIENLIRERFGINKVSAIVAPPFERHIFYEIGSRYIEALIRNDIALKGNLEALFQKMIQYE